MANLDSEIKREKNGTGSRRGTVPIARIRELREKAKCAVNIVHVDRITEDYEAIVTDKKRKISEVTLRYMLKKRVIKSHLFAVYLGANSQPEERIMTEINVVCDVNTKFIELYDKT